MRIVDRDFAISKDFTYALLIKQWSYNSNPFSDRFILHKTLMMFRSHDIFRVWPARPVRLDHFQLAGEAKVLSNLVVISAIV